MTAKFGEFREFRGGIPGTLYKLTGALKGRCGKAPLRLRSGQAMSKGSARGDLASPRPGGRMTRA